jgi:hypothetical protein
LSLGAGVIGDIYKLEERGIGIGIFLGVRDHYDWIIYWSVILTRPSQAMLFGFSIAPFLGGKSFFAIFKYAESSSGIWTGAAAEYWSWRNLHYSLAAWSLVELLLIYLSFPETSHPGTLGIDKLKRRRWINITWVNPLSCLWLLRSPNLFAVVSAYTLCVGLGTKSLASCVM